MLCFKNTYAIKKSWEFLISGIVDIVNISKGSINTILKDLIYLRRVKPSKTLDLLAKNVAQTFVNQWLLIAYVWDKTEKPRQSHPKIQVMFTAFFDYRGVVHYEFVPIGQTVWQWTLFEYYLFCMMLYAVKGRNYE